MYFDLKRYQKEPTADSLAGCTRPLVSPLSVLRKKKILVVDDCPVVLAMLSDAFGEDYAVTTAESGEAAVEILENPVRVDTQFKDPFDLIITDLKMPGITGFELSQYVRERNKVHKYTPVIMLTTEKISKVDARKRGCVACFSKADKQRLFSMVHILMST